MIQVPKIACENRSEIRQDSYKRYNIYENFYVKQSF